MEAARVRRLISAGGLVSDDVVEEVVRARLEQHDWNYGFILDGFPRNRHQAEFFLESLDIDAVIQRLYPGAPIDKNVKPVGSAMRTEGLGGQKVRTAYPTIDTDTAAFGVLPATS